ncbi:MULTISPECIES: copper chaperone PCu(A)C [Paracoccus]|uniref:Copper chaperone PCu(A)C n=1 Tax=Paracoccus fontiphilus TaxID=1815556 RepID=A0ABV7IBS2_9RHOB|nr:copper chaperone PCu(A)C [Paracoccus shandongensis]
MTMKGFALALGCAMLLPAIASADCVGVTAGDLTISKAWSRVTIGTQRPAVFYVEIRNAGKTDDRLIGIETPIAGMPMLHQTVIQDGVAAMPHAEAVDVPAGKTISLEPGGYHGMLMELTTALSEGQTFPITLTFEKAGAVEIDTLVLPMRAQEAQCDGAS